MSKNILIKLMAAFILVNCFAKAVYADVAPDPVYNTISSLPFVLVAAVVVVAFVLIKKFFKK